jgi:hypothetical protein
MMLKSGRVTAFRRLNVKIVVNGTTVELPDGSNVSVVGDQVLVNGKPTDIKFSNDLKIEVVGGLINLKTDRGSVVVHGDVAGLVDASGSVQCGNVGGKVDANGSVTCGEVKGNVDASGSVKCGNVGGKVDAGGSVRMG